MLEAAFLLGLIFGSFLNVCIHRIPRGESINYPPSHCPTCRMSLKPWDLIPLLSFLILRGKCRSCGEKISLRYPFIEFINGLGWAGIILYQGLTPEGVAGLFLFSLALVITLIDLEHFLIPDGLVIALFIGGLIYHFLSNEGSLLNRLGGAAFGFTLLLLLAYLSKGGMGGGDIKLTFALGFWLGFPSIFYALFLGAFLGSLVGLSLILLGLKQRQDPIPFGPFLMIGFLIMFFFEKNLLDIYWSLFS